MARKNVKKIRLGIVGLGNHGGKIAAAILKSKNLVLGACCHYKRDEARRFAGKYKCRYFDNLKTMAFDENIDAVAIVTPNHLHFDQLKLCISAGKHIFVEKPITNTLEEAKKIIGQCRKKGLVLMVGHNYRRNGYVRKIGELVDKKTIGEVVSAEINISHGGGMKFTKDDWRYHKYLCPGGPLIMVGIHAAEISNYLFGNAKQVSAIVKKLYAPMQAEDTSGVLIELERGGVVYLCNNYNTPQMHFIRVMGTMGVLEYNKNNNLLTLRGPDRNCASGGVRDIKFSNVDTFLEEMEDFGTSISNKKNPETGAQEAWDALAIVEAALESYKSKRFITVKKLK
ncbi:Gfo/Idh/MocA family oxidoreductase [Candidatus Wolfebacteria bacterium]|nr:Gfo/Idh/MocA family oxidoreductase [Candidatus Wolfebacteria bacterium]